MESIIDRISELLRQHIGLDVASIGSSALEHSLKVRMKAIGVSHLDEYWYRLSEQEELQELIETIIVPETWFFRQQPVFEALADYAISEWLPSNIVGNLRVLSLPCATGEEAYSIVMALLDAGFPIDRLSVDAVDISQCAIQQAMKGFYRPYSFRSENLGFRDRYFTAEADGFRLNQQVRKRVDFFKGNILHLEELALADKYNVIFCRNLLIYLDEQSRQTLVNELANRLDPSGLLFAGSAEAVFFNGKGFQSHGPASSSGFRKDKRESAKPYITLPSIVTESAPVNTKKKQLRKPVRSVTPIPSKSRVNVHSRVEIGTTQLDEPSNSESIDELLSKAALLADKGQLDNAEELCQRSRKIFGDSAQAFYLSALIYDARGKEEMAEKFYRNALYLDSAHIESLLHLATLLSLKGDGAQAKQLRERAQRVKGRK